MFSRIIFKNFRNSCFQGKVLLLIGARQVGKTFFVEQVLSQYPEKDLIKFNCDYLDDRNLISHQHIENLKKIIIDKKIVFIDEAQKVESIGEVLKILVDLYKDTKQIIATGSSSINLLDGVSETLTGRKEIFNLYPLSSEEIKNKYDLRYLQKNLEELLIYGTYPAVLNSNSIALKIKTLEEISSSYLYKDVFEFEDIKKSFIIDKLIKILALQIGSEISFNNIAQILGVDIKTVEKYIHLLEKSFVIKLLAPYSVGGKREITKKHKLYFLDLGIRNAVLNNYNNFDMRNDIGQLWENWMIIERMKYLKNHQIPHKLYFWRTYDGAEVDLVEEREGKLIGYEFKYQGKPRYKPKQWLEHKNSSYQVINRENFDEIWNPSVQLS